MGFCSTAGVYGDIMGGTHSERTTYFVFQVKCSIEGALALYTMPKLRVCGRAWAIGTDDFVMPSALSMYFRLLSLAFLITIIILLHLKLLKCDQPYFYLSLYLYGCLGITGVCEIAFGFVYCSTSFSKMVACIDMQGWPFFCQSSHFVCASLGKTSKTKTRKKCYTNYKAQQNSNTKSNSTGF